jgi:uncharacterized membrane protein
VPLDGSPADGVARFTGVAAGTGQEAAGPVSDDRPGPLPPGAAAGGQTGGEPPAAGRGYRDPVLWLITATVFAAYTAISVFRYLRRDPTSWDLGIFTEYVKQFAHLHAPIVDIRGPGFNLLGDHFHPIVALIAPFFWLFPTPVTLLIAQALLAAVSVLPVYRAAADLLSRGAGLAIAAAYGFSWGLQEMVNYDFHEIAFAVPLLAFSLSALIRGRTRAAICWALPLVLVKEDQGFTLAAIGLIIALSYRRRGPGLFLAGWGLAWSLLAILVIIPHFSASHTYAYWTQAGAISPVGGHFSIGGLWARLGDGIAVKLPTLALILLPTAFIALRSPLVLAIVPSLALRFVGMNPDYWGTQWHYNATVMPVVFIAAIDAMARIRARKAEPAPDGQDWLSLARSGASRGGRVLEHYGAAAMLALAAGLAFQFSLSSLWTPSTYTLGPHVAAENAAMALVPNGAKVATDLDLLAPLAARTDTYWLGNFSDPVTTYVVFDTQSTDWQPPPTNVLAFVESLEHGKPFRQIYEQDGVYVFRRAN